MMNEIYFDMFKKQADRLRPVLRSYLSVGGSLSNLGTRSLAAAPGFLILPLTLLLTFSISLSLHAKPSTPCMVSDLRSKLYRTITTFHTKSNPTVMTETEKHRYLQTHLNDVKPNEKTMYDKLKRTTLHASLAALTGLTLTSIYLLLASYLRNTSTGTNGNRNRLEILRDELNWNQEMIRGVQRIDGDRTDATSWLDSIPCMPLDTIATQLLGMIGCRTISRAIKTLSAPKNIALLCSTTSIVFLIIRWLLKEQPTPFCDTFQRFIADWPEHKDFVPEDFHELFDGMYECFLGNGNKLDFNEEDAQKLMAVLDWKILKKFD